MLSKEEIKEKLEQYFVQNFPEESQEFAVNLISEKAIDPESETVKRLVLDFQLASNSQQYNSTSQMFRSCLVLAKAFHEPDLVAQLENIYYSKADNFSVPFLQWLFLKGMKVGGLTSIYNINDEEYSIGTLNTMLEDKKTKIYEIFGQIQRNYSFKRAEFDWSKQISNNDANVSFDDLIKD